MLVNTSKKQHSSMRRACRSSSYCLQAYRRALPALRETKAVFTQCAPTTCLTAHRQNRAPTMAKFIKSTRNKRAQAHLSSGTKTHAIQQLQLLLLPVAGAATVTAPAACAGTCPSQTLLLLANPPATTAADAGGPAVGMGAHIYTSPSPS